MGSPETFITSEPVHRFLHRRGGQSASDGASGLVAYDQTGVREDIEVFHDCRQRMRKRSCQLAYGNGVMFTKLRQQTAPRAIGKRREHPIQPSILILNHWVNC